MQQHSLLPPIAYNNHSAPVQFNRRRNLSLGSRKQLDIITIPHEQHQILSNQNTTRNNYHSKKNHLFKVTDKLKGLKNPTRLCQQSMIKYQDLKKELTDIKLYEKTCQKQNDRSLCNQATNPEETSKKTLNIVNLSIHKHKNKRIRLFPAFDHIKIEKNNSQLLDQGNQNQTDLYVSSITENTPKKYNDMTLREIIESQNQFDPKLQLFRKIRELRVTIERNIKESEMTHQSQKVEGW